MNLTEEQKAEIRVRWATGDKETAVARLIELTCAKTVAPEPTE